MWISRKKWSELEKRVADLEKQVQSQLVTFSPNVIVKDGVLSLYPRRKKRENGVKDNNLEG